MSATWSQTMQRSTRQRTAIRDAIDAAGRPLTASEIFEAALENVPGLAMTTVHRNLRALLASSKIAIVALPGERLRFERACRGSRHHFKCNTCKTVFVVDEDAQNTAALAPDGFTVERQSLVVYGTCPRCVMMQRHEVHAGCPAGGGLAKPADVSGGRGDSADEWLNADCIQQVSARAHRRV
jgi:Fur family ferric uptake transcriptional regulator